MTEILKLTQQADHSWWLTQPTSPKPIRICTVAQAVKILKRSQRQIYRYIELQKLIPLQKVLGEWILDYQSVQRLAETPPLIHKIPKAFQSYFPEYNLTKLNAGEARMLLISRLLDVGGLAEVHWLVKRYGQAALSRFVKTKGYRHLSRRSFHFWCLFFNVRAKPFLPHKDPIWSNR